MKHKIVNFRADRISGWFYDREAEGAKGALELLVNEEPVAAVTCNVFRSDLSPEEFPNRNVGFLTGLPPGYWTGATYNVSLRDRRTGRVLHKQYVDTQDLQLVESPGFSGEFKLTELGEIAGWAAQDHQTVNLRVFVDGHQVDEARARQQKPLWAEARLPMIAPIGFAYSYQVPVDYFDGSEHRVQIVVDPDSEEIVFLDQVVRLDAGHAEAAAEQTERLRRGVKDWSHRWRKIVSKRDNLDVTRMELTPDYAAVTVAGAVRNKRAVLRLGEEVIALSAVTALHPEDAHHEQNGRLHRYAGVIPSSAWAQSHVPLFEAENDLTDTYDLRMGDESGRRPGELPARLHTDFDGYRATSPVELDAGRLEGWVVDTAAVNQPNDVVLLSSTPEGTEELARAESSRTHRDVQRRYGISNSGGYSLPLPLQVLQDEAVHLQLVTKDDDGSFQVLWEQAGFHATDAFLLDQALNTPSTSKAVDLLQRVRKSGREAVVNRFLTRHGDAQAPLTLSNIEDALNSTASQDLSLEPTTGAIWYWVQELRRNSGRIQWFTQSAVRNRLGDARDILAYAASKGRFDFAQLHGVLESSRAELFREHAVERFQKDSWITATVCLARYLYSAPRDETDHLDALTLYGLVDESAGTDGIHGADRAYFGDLLTWRGEFAAAHSALATGDADPEHHYSHKLLALNVINPHISQEHGRSGAWLDELNSQFATGGVAPIQLRGDEVSFYNLSSDAAETHALVEDGPLVSVIVPIYEPSAATNIAVQSLFSQTWRNLEILIIDDCSPVTDENGNPTGYKEQLEAFAAADSRVRLVFNEKNRGSYSVRNDALDLAEGKYVTVADKDDWHHPQRIELQVRHLEDHTDLVANMTNWLRVGQNLKLMLRSNTGRVAYPSMPSLMFRREQVLNDVGYWDTVRKSGDSEFKSRLENYYGAKIEPINQVPLAFALMEGANLTRNDMGVGYLAPDRLSYLRAYKYWHREIREDGASPFMPNTPEKRLFVAPPEYLPDRDTTPQKYDVVFASEFGFLAGNSTSLFTEMSVCLEADLKVGVIPFQNGLFPSAAKRQFNRKIDELVLTGQVDRMSLDTAAETDLLIVRWPTALQAVRDDGAALDARQAVVVANHPPFEPGGRRSYDVGVVTRNVERLFGVRPTWAPQSEQIGAMLKPLMPASDIERFSWKGIIEVKVAASRNRYHDGQPVIGRHGRDDPAKWPSSRSVFRQVYPIDGSARVCILGGANTAMKRGLLPRHPRGWEVYAFNEISVDEYLTAKIDFFVYFHSDDWVEAFGMAILEAMSYGVVCVLPKHFEPVFKDAAVYVDLEDVQATVQHLWDPQRYADQQQRAIDFIEAECTSAAYLRRLERLGVEVKV